MDHYSELRTLATVSVAVAMAMSYARFAASRIPAGIPRLAALLPVISLLPLLPFSFSSILLRGISAFFLSWLSLFKLLLLSFGVGPSTPPSPSSPSSSSPLSPSISATPQMHPYLLLSLYCAHFYLAIDLVFAFSAVVVGRALRVDLEPQFNKPYLATSLGDFWAGGGTSRSPPCSVLPFTTLCAAASAPPLLRSPHSSSPGSCTRPCSATPRCGSPQGSPLRFRVAWGGHGGRGSSEEVEVVAPEGVGAAAAIGGDADHRGVRHRHRFGLFFKPLVSSGVDARLLEECGTVLRFLEGTAAAFLRRALFFYTSFSSDERRSM
uniref:Uncharacterized protein n=1 Tax=Ananas comosus var. bracteatus TaxID=296719 RepID=A0A6V7QLE8_ANACO|nr:unnamed protein product [Ananas comosus var. bracteatus]